MFQKVKQSEGGILRNVMLIFSILAFFVFVVALSVYYMQAHMEHTTCNSIIPIPVVGVLMASLGFFIGALVYYVLSSKFVHKCELVTKNNYHTLNFLALDERKLVKQLINNDTISQAALAKLTGMSRVKVHRVLKKLEAKGVIEKTDSKISLKSELKELF